MFVGSGKLDFDRIVSEADGVPAASSTVTVALLESPKRESESKNPAFNDRCGCPTRDSAVAGSNGSDTA